MKAMIFLLSIVHLGYGKSGIQSDSAVPIGKLAVTKIPLDIRPPSDFNEYGFMNVTHQHIEEFIWRFWMADADRKSVPWRYRTADPIQFVARRSFRIPLIIEHGKNQIKTIRVVYSNNRGKIWLMTGEVLPTAEYVDFTPKEAGLYWFAAQVICKDGKTYPKSKELRPQLKVIVSSSSTK